MTNKIRLNTDDREAIYDAYINGYSPKKLADLYHVAPSYIMGVLKMYKKQGRFFGRKIDFRK